MGQRENSVSAAQVTLDWIRHHPGSAGCVLHPGESVYSVAMVFSFRSIRAAGVRGAGAGQRRALWAVMAAVVFGVLFPPSGSMAAQEGPVDIAGLEAIRGSVVKVAGENYFVKTPGGVIYKVATGANTHFVHDEQASSDVVIRVGDSVLAGGELDEKQHTLGAIFVAAVDARQLLEFDRRRAEFGKTWLAGTVTSIHGTQLVVKRPDDVTTTVSVDENTSFHKHHEDITLGDIQVGDGLTARGTMGKSSFAGTLLTVVDAREISQWARLRDR